MYGKVFESIYDGSLYGEFEAIVVFKAMIVLADQTGVVDMSPTALAGRTSYPIDVVKKGLAVLQQPDADSRSNIDEGRRIVPLDNRAFGWKIVNYRYYRQIASREEKRTADRERLREKRNKNNDVAACRAPSHGVANVADTYTDTDTDTDTDTPPPAKGGVTTLAKIEDPAQGQEGDATLMTEGYSLTDAMYQAATSFWAERQRYDLDVQNVFARFKSHHIEKGTVRRSWDLSWRVWLTDEIKYKGAANERNQPNVKRQSNLERLIDEQRAGDKKNTYDQETTVKS